MSKSDGRAKTSGSNLAKARQAKLEKQKQDKELNKYIIFDSDDEEEEPIPEEEVYEPPKKARGAGKAKPKKIAVKKARAPVKKNESQQKAAAIMKEIEDLKNEFKRMKKPEPEEKPVEVEKPIENPVEVPTPQPVPAPIPAKPILFSDILKNKMMTRF